MHGAVNQKHKNDKVLLGMKKADVLVCSWVHYKDGVCLENEALGLSNKNKLTPDTPLGMASLSKPIFAYLILRLAEEGIINLNEPLSETCVHECLHGIESRDKHGSEHVNAVTPLMVLQHREGFPVKVNDRLERFEFKPGSAFSYSGLGIAWLQQVIEKKTGASLEDLAQKYVFGDLQMTNSSFLSPAEQKAEKKPNGQAWNSLYSTPVDYALFVKACLSKKGLPQDCSPFAFDPEFTMKKDAWAVACEVPEESLEKMGWGLLFGLQKTEDGIKGWHNGDMNGKRAFVLFDVKEDGMGDLFVFAADSEKDNGFALLDSVLPQGIKIDPLRTYVSEKLGFALDLKPGWESDQQKRMEKIDDYFATAQKTELKTEDVHERIEPVKTAAKIQSCPAHLPPYILNKQCGDMIDPKNVEARTDNEAKTESTHKAKTPFSIVPKNPTSHD